MNHTLEHAVGQMLIVGFEGLTPPDHILDWITSGRIGGVILFARNCESPEQVARLTQTLHDAARDAGRPPLLIGIDQEGGTVARLRDGFTESPGAMALGAANDELLAEAVSSMLARELRALGINWDYAPVVDLTHNVQNGSVGTRSPGSDPQAVSRIVAAEVRGFQREGVAAAAKHFPGLGNTPVDTHLALAVISGSLDYLWNGDLVPFRAAVAAGVASVMVSHVKFEALDPDYPATLSPVIVKRLLRGELGYDGAVCTDSMEMKAVSDGWGAGESAVLAALAGIDLLMFSHYRDQQTAAYDALLDAAQTGRLPAAMIDAANARIAALKARYAITAPPDPALIRNPDHLALAERAARAGTVLLYNDDALPVSPQTNAALVEFGSLLDSLAMDQGDLGGFARRVQARAPEWDYVSLHAANPKPDLFERARALAASADVLVLATRSAHLMPEQLATARDLIARRAGRPTVLICLRNPYDAGALNDAQTVICTCGDSAPSLDAAVGALFGDFVPTGRLPVEVTP